MDWARRLREGIAAAVLVVAPVFACAQGFRADYDLARLSSPEPLPTIRFAPAASLGGDSTGVGLSVRTGQNWFGQVGLSQGTIGPLLPTNDILNVAGGYRWSDGQSLSLQLSRGRGPGQRLGLAVNYDWPHYFMRLSYEQGWKDVPQDSLRFSAGVRF